MSGLPIYDEEIVASPVRHLIWTYLLAPARMRLSAKESA